MNFDSVCRVRAYRMWASLDRLHRKQLKIELNALQALASMLNLESKNDMYSSRGYKNAFSVPVLSCWWFFFLSRWRHDTNDNKRLICFVWYLFALRVWTSLRSFQPTHTTASTPYSTTKCIHKQHNQINSNKYKQ